MQEATGAPEGRQFKHDSRSEDKKKNPKQLVHTEDLENKALACALAAERKNVQRLRSEKMFLQKEVNMFNFQNALLRHNLSLLNKKLKDIDLFMNVNLPAAIELSNIEHLTDVSTSEPRCSERFSRHSALSLGEEQGFRMTGMALRVPSSSIGGRRTIAAAAEPVPGTSMDNSLRERSANQSTRDSVPATEGAAIDSPNGQKLRVSDVLNSDVCELVIKRKKWSTASRSRMHSSKSDFNPNPRLESGNWAECELNPEATGTTGPSGRSPAGTEWNSPQRVRRATAAAESLPDPEISSNQSEGTAADLLLEPNGQSVGSLSASRVCSAKGQSARQDKTVYDADMEMTSIDDSAPIIAERPSSRTFWWFRAGQEKTVYDADMEMTSIDDSAPLIAVSSLSETHGERAESCIPVKRSGECMEPPWPTEQEPLEEIKSETAKLSRMKSSETATAEISKKRQTRTVKRKSATGCSYVIHKPGDRAAFGASLASPGATDLFPSNASNDFIVPATQGLSVETESKGHKRALGSASGKVTPGGCTFCYSSTPADKCKTHVLPTKEPIGPLVRESLLYTPLTQPSEKPSLLVSDSFLLDMVSESILDPTVGNSFLEFPLAADATNSSSIERPSSNNPDLELPPPEERSPKPSNFRVYSEKRKVQGVAKGEDVEPQGDDQNQSADEQGAELGIPAHRDVQPLQDVTNATPRTFKLSPKSDEDRCPQGFGRRRRKPVNYKEPSLATKLRWGDPNTSMECSPIYRYKKKPRKIKVKSKVGQCNARLLSGLTSCRRSLATISIHCSASSMKDILVPEAYDFEQWEPEGVAPGSPITAVVPKWKVLTTLDLSHNRISCIDESVKLIPEIEFLDFSHNDISTIENLQHLYNLIHLDLSYNKLADLTGIYTKVGNIKTLSLAGNVLESLRGLNKLYSLVNLDLSQNRIEQLEEVRNIGGLPCLEGVLLAGNPLTVIPDYRTKVLALFGDRASEVCLDSTRTTEKELDTVEVLKAIQKSRDARNKLASSEKKQ